MKEINIYAILCYLMKSLNYVVYEYILIKRVTEEVKRMLTVINVNRVFTQSLTLVLLCFIEAARTLLLNKKINLFNLIIIKEKLKTIIYLMFSHTLKKLEIYLELMS